MAKQKAVFVDNICIGRKVSKMPFSLRSITFAASHDDERKLCVQGYLIVPIEQVKDIQLFDEFTSESFVLQIEVDKKREDLKLLSRFKREVVSIVSKFAISRFINKLIGN